MGSAGKRAGMGQMKEQGSFFSLLAVSLQSDRMWPIVGCCCTGLEKKITNEYHYIHKLQVSLLKHTIYQ